MGGPPPRPRRPPPPPPPPEYPLKNDRCYRFDNTAFYLDSYRNEFLIQALGGISKSDCQNRCDNTPGCQSGMQLSSGIGNGRGTNYSANTCYLLNNPLWGGGCNAGQGCTAWSCPNEVPLSNKKCYSLANHAYCLDSFNPSKILEGPLYAVNRTQCQERCENNPQCKSGMWVKSTIGNTWNKYEGRMCYLLKEPMQFCGCDPSQGCTAWDCKTDTRSTNKCQVNTSGPRTRVNPRDVYKVRYNQTSKIECQNLCDNDPGCLAGVQASGTITATDGSTWPAGTCLLLRKNFTNLCEGDNCESWNCNVPACVSIPPGFNSADRVKITGRVGGTVYGNNPYDATSKWETAVIHAGFVQNGQTGWFRFIPVERQDYNGSTQNGVTSLTKWENSCGFKIEFIKMYDYCEDDCSECCAASKCDPIRKKRRELLNQIEQITLQIKIETNAMEDAKKAYNDVAESIKNEINILKNSETTAKAVLIEVTKKEERRKNELIQQFADDMLTLNNNHKLSVLRLNQNLEELKQKSIQEITKKYGDMKQAYEKKLSDVDDLLTNYKNKEVTDLAKLTDELKAKGEEAKQKLNKIMEEKENEIENMYSQLEIDRMKKIRKLTADHQASLAKAKADSDAKLLPIQQRIDEENKKFQDFKDQIDNNVNQLKENLRKTTELYNKQIADLEKTIKEREQYNKDVVTKLRNDYYNKLQIVNSGTIEEKENLLIDTRKFVDEKLTEVNNRKQLINKEFDEKKKQLESEFLNMIQQQKDDYKKRLEDLRISNKITIDELSTLNDGYKYALEETRVNLYNLNEDHKIMVVKMARDFEKIKNKYQQQFYDKLEELGKEKIELVKKSNDALIKEINLVVDQMAVIKEEVKDEMKEYNIQALAIITELENEKIEVIKKQNAELEQEIQKVNDKYLDKRLELQKELEEIIKRKMKLKIVY